jgi:hypothetical protein
MSTTHRPVRLTRDAALLAIWTIQHHGTITPELIGREAPEVGANDYAVTNLLDALERTGVQGVRALAHYDVIES